MATNFPAGIRSRGIPIPSGGDLLTTGDVFHVDSGHPNGDDAHSGLNPRQPKLTMDSAYNAAVANNGDVLLVSEGHAETLADATSLVMDKAGIKIIGLGRGADRPTLTMSAAGSNVPISGAGNVLKNILMTPSGVTDVTAGITVSAADVLLEDVELRESGATSQFVDGILGTTCDRLEIVRPKFIGLLAGDATQAAISITGTPAEIKIIDAWLVGEFAAAGIDITGVATDVMLRDLLIHQLSATVDPCITVAATVTGFLVNAFLRTAGGDDAAITAALTAVNALQIYNLQIVNTGGEFGLIGASEVVTLDTAHQAWGAPSVIA